ncbi:MAG: sugar transferase [Anaerolineales bacterium]|nr:sugar transferase [Anaerolineales bacterium]
MDRNEAGYVEKGALSAWIQRLVRLLGWLLASAALAFLAWLDLQGAAPAPWSPGRLLFQASLQILLVITLERCLVQTALERNWRYRLAFLISASLPLLYRFVQGLPWADFTSLLWWSWQALQILFSVLFAFIGGVLSTALDDGLWENNSPPAESTRIDVYQRHQEVIGSPDHPPPFLKRLFDLALALSGLILSAPVWLLSCLVIWLEDPGPLLFVKNSVGLGGITFFQFKLRTMVRGAEESTGPVLSQENDQRVLMFGRLLRKTALDELPQLINILRGEMSFVGPRPQRTVLVQGYLQQMPEYAQRHRVLPGLSGLAQVAGDYYLTPRQKLRFDRLYIRHASLGFDLKLLWLAFLITFWYRWQKGWDGRLPRHLLRLGSPVSHH